MSKVTLMIIMASSILYSCQIKNKIINEKDKQTNSPKNKLELFQKTNFSPDNISFNGDIIIKKEGISTSLKAVIKLKKDNLIWVSVRLPIGLEIFRIRMDKDSIWFLNRTNKTYFKKNISHIERLINSKISYNEIQEILFPLFISEKNIKITENGLLHDQIIIKEGKIEYYIHSKFLRVEKIKIEESDLEKAIFEYSEFKSNTVDNFNQSLEKPESPFQITVPYTLNIIISSEEESFEAILNHKKITFDVIDQVEFNIPKKYVESH